MLLPIHSFLTVCWTSYRCRAGMACVTVGLLLSVAVTTGAMAQDSSHVHIASGQTYGVALAVIQVRPAGIVVNPKTHTATVQFINNSYDTVHAEITMQDTLPRNSGADDPTTTDSLQSAPGAKRWSLVSWIQDAPTQITLAPRTTRAVTLHLTVPSGLIPGDYSAYVVARISGVQVAQRQMDIMKQFFGSVPGMKIDTSKSKVRLIGGPYSAAHLVYDVSNH